MTKARKIYPCYFNCGFMINPGDEYEAWAEDDESGDFIASKTIAFRIHIECYRLYVAFGGDYETNEDHMMEFLTEMLFKYDIDVQKYRETYTLPGENYGDLDWVLRAVDGGLRPKDMTDKEKEAWNRWMAWRNSRKVRKGE
jgi:hypothetical protein